MMERLNMTNKLIAGVAGALMLFTFTACEKEFYEDEQYRKEIYIVSGDNNIFGQEYTFGKANEGYFSVYVGGSMAIDRDVEVKFALNRDLLREYNQRNFGTKYSEYVQELPQNYYTPVNGWEIPLTSGSVYTLFPLKVDINELLPDENYFIPLSISSVSDYQFSEKKGSVLFQIFMKNDYATTKTSTYYSMNGTIYDLREFFGNWNPNIDGSNPTAFNATKLVVPISENAIRILPGTTQSTDRAILNQKGISVTVTDEDVEVPVLGDDGLPTGETVKMKKVMLEPYIGSGANIQVREAAEGINQGAEQKLISYYDPDKKQFTLNYCYRMPDEKVKFDLFGSPAEADVWHKVKEVMTLMKMK